MTTKWNEPFDKPIIDTLRANVDAHELDPYADTPFSINYLYLSRVIASMEKGLELERAIKRVEALCAERDGDGPHTEQLPGRSWLTTGMVHAALKGES